MNELDQKKLVDQDARLTALRINRTPCTIITTNGVQMKGTIETFDRYVVLVRSATGRSSMIYKHALSTIVVEAPAT
ncbi:RNA chaperone Hfq [Paenibacillus methanolicus]|uniref:Host factor-I protein n=1 Tax=Paenibacillus methanolicus TaxID=582686 RepID=A0A5S5CI18_9BACL|nr:RNA chaperone Hfq [Paenibacillus methanolicus]TYP78258.1 host factor-I protein [Paenibacillus methanolicus]